MKVIQYEIRISNSAEFLDINAYVQDVDDHYNVVVNLEKIHTIARKLSVDVVLHTDNVTGETAADLLVDGEVLCTIGEQCNPRNTFDGIADASGAYDAITRFMGF